MGSMESLQKKGIQVFIQIKAIRTSISDEIIKHGIQLS